MLLIALSLLVAHAGSVTLDGATWARLRGPEADAPPVLPGIFVDDRAVTLSTEDERVRVVATWHVRAIKPSFAELRLGDLGWSPERVRVDGREGAVEPRGDGWWLITWVDRPVAIEFIATRAGDPSLGEVTIDLLPAPRGAVTAPGLHVAAIDPALRVGGSTRAAGRFKLVPADLRVGDRGDLVMATSAVGLTLGDGEARVRARVSWEVRRGRLATLGVDAPGAGRDLDVRGNIVRSWRREGDRVIIEPLRPVDTSATVELSWTLPLPATTEAKVTVPRVNPAGAYRTEGALVLARATEAEAVPEVPATPIARVELPKWADGLVDGEPTAFYKLGGPPSGSVSVVRYEPMEQPPILIDIADVRLATSDEGRVLSRTYLTVRNERAARLRIVPPAGTTLVGVQVSGEPIVPARDDGPGWLVALPRSVETVDGLLTFPIEIIALGTGEAWDEKERRSLPLLQFDAQVALTRVTLALPPGWHDRTEGGDAVEAFTEGETMRYGLAVGDAAAAQVDALLQDAVDSWLDNDWRSAQDKLDEIRGAGGDNENVRRLQGNLDLVAGKDTGATEIVERRVREQALARASTQAQEAEQSLREAEEAEQRGDTAEAEKKYEEAYQKVDVAAKLERTESMTYKSVQSSSSAGLSKAKKKEAEKQVRVESDGKNFDSNEDLGTLLLTEGEATGFGMSGAGVGGGGAGAGGLGGGELGWLDGDLQDEKSGLLAILAREDPEPPAPDDDAEFDGRSLDDAPIDFEGIDISGDSFAEGGTVGGVLGGGVNGSLGGAAAPEPAPVQTATTVTQDYLQRIPSGRSYQSAVGQAAGATRRADRAPTTAAPAPPPPPADPKPTDRRTVTEEESDDEAYFTDEDVPMSGASEAVNISSRGRGERAARGPQAPGTKGRDARIEKPAAMTLEIGGRSDGDAEVFASALTVYVPTLGETVLYQHLLLESDTPYQIAVDAVRRAKDRRIQ